MRTARPLTIVVVLSSAALALCSCKGWLDADARNSSEHPAPSSGPGQPWSPTNNQNGQDDGKKGDDGKNGSGKTPISCKGVNPPGETPLRRLTETEFNNTVADLFPSLGLSGFDIPGDEKLGPFKANISSGVGQLVAERYRSASEDISKKVVSNFEKVTGCKPSQSSTTIAEKEAEDVGSSVGKAYGDIWNLWANGTLETNVSFPRDGEYVIKITAAGTKAKGVGPKMDILVDGAGIDSVTVSAPESSPKVYSATTNVKKGSHSVGVRFTNDYADQQTGEDRNLILDKLAVESTGISTNGIEGCIDSFITDLGARAWRRPLSANTKSRLTSLFDDAEKEYGPDFALRVVVEAVLQSPRFLYRFEYGESGKAGNEAVQLDDYELASRLSYFLWNTAPDEKLLKAAKNGELSTEKQIEKHARRMVQDKRARNALNRALLAMIGLRNFENDGKHAGSIDKSLRKAMKEETLSFIDHVLWEGDGRLKTLLTANYSYLNSETAKLYGVQGPGGDGNMKVSLEDKKMRGGLLTQPALLARHGYGEKIVHRGLFVQETFLCNGPPDPPDKFVDPPQRQEGESDRSLSQKRMQHKQCGPCHQQMDPVGLAFNQFDKRGRYVETDKHDNQLSSKGKLVGTENSDGDVNGPRELSKRIAGSKEARKCFSKQWLTRAIARVPQREETCAVRTINSALDKSNGDLKEMFVAIATTEAFRYKPVKQSK